MQARRLKTQSQFQALLASPPLARTEHFVMHRLDLQTGSELPAPTAAPGKPFPAGGLWLGAMVPKRWARRAVTRNLIKRQIYSIGERRLLLPADAAYLVRLRSGYDRQRFQSAASDLLRVAVRSEIEQLFDRSRNDRRVAA
ncbi:MAG: ribonuclease P protein component [Hylemonella sp.]|uniref:ribonuclease P protein component n=1 Tax=Hylemonella sp. TaxID=2066020 RepID=UPI00391B1E5F